MRKKVAVSACLLGRKCRFDGEDRYDERLVRSLDGFEVIGLCPEELAGFKGKRGPFEIVGTAEDVFLRKAKVVDIEGRDVTDMFIKGAVAALNTVKEMGAELVMLKSKSPSCSPDFVHDGHFKGRIIEGLGLFAYLLRENNIKYLAPKLALENQAWRLL